ncbi:hypothetical protein [Peribacillus acanthi]|uniref:hypothetical protein n=1 Tax=Peribacillus acanthi TaxID=2171554 RepID=UPI000D3EC2B7|nr:hypothetical protein [Peribacillus acanthi]
MNNWLPVLFRMAKSQDFLKMFGRKKRSNGMLWATLIGLGVSAAALGLGRNNKQNTTADTVQSLMSDLKLPNINMGQMPKMANLTEFAKELAPNNNGLNNQNQNQNQNKNNNPYNNNPNKKQ